MEFDFVLGNKVLGSLFTCCLRGSGPGEFVDLLFKGIRSWGVCLPFVKRDQVLRSLLIFCLRGSGPEEFVDLLFTGTRS